MPILETRWATPAAYYCARSDTTHGVFCNKCDEDMQNLVLRAALEAEPAVNQVELHAYASQYVAKFTSQAWASGFITSLEETEDSEGLRGLASAPFLPLA